jgi:hypothetical protein
MDTHLLRDKKTQLRAMNTKLARLNYQYQLTHEHYKKLALLTDIDNLRSAAKALFSEIQALQKKH